MRWELFVRGKRIAALEARMGVLEARVNAVFQMIEQTVRENGVPVPGEEKPEKPPLRVVR